MCRNACIGCTPFGVRGASQDAGLSWEPSRALTSRPTSSILLDSVCTTEHAPTPALHAAVCGALGLGLVRSSGCPRGAQGGPRLSWGALTGSRACASEAECAVFRDRTPSTIAMTVLVVVEMFNALNALSENASLAQVGLRVFHLSNQHLGFWVSATAQGVHPFQCAAKGVE